jgi:hypothetical protein
MFKIATVKAPTRRPIIVRVRRRTFRRAIEKRRAIPLLAEHIQKFNSPTVYVKDQR